MALSSAPSGLNLRLPGSFHPPYSAWDWKNRNNHYWKEPAPEVHYLANRSNNNGLKRSLDLGCGVGRHSIFLFTIGFDVYSFDFSEDSVMKLKEIAKEKVVCPIRNRKYVYYS